MEVLGVNSLENVTVKELHECLQPDSLLERFAAKKASGVSTNKDFLDIKGAKG